MSFTKELTKEQEYNKLIEKINQNKNMKDISDIEIDYIITHSLYDGINDESLEQQLHIKKQIRDMPPFKPLWKSYFGTTQTCYFFQVVERIQSQAKESFDKKNSWITE